MTPTAKCVTFAQMPHLGAVDATKSLGSVSSVKITSICTKRMVKLRVSTATPMTVTVSDATQVAALAVLHATSEWATFASTFGRGDADYKYCFTLINTKMNTLPPLTAPLVPLTKRERHPTNYINQLDSIF
jgi:hypothetical protein